MSKAFCRMMVIAVLLTTIVVPLQAWAGGSSGTDGVPDAARVVQQGDYDVIVLGEDISPQMHAQVKDQLVRTYGDRVLTWTVQERDGLQYVYAYPFRSDDPQNRSQGNPDDATRTTRDAMHALITKAGGGTPEATLCSRLYQYYFWQGSQFMVCGTWGIGVRGYSRLALYGYDNVASSNIADSTQLPTYLYDGNYYTYYLTRLLGVDLAIFPSWLNNKASSIKVIF